VFGPVAEDNTKTQQFAPSEHVAMRKASLQQYEQHFLQAKRLFFFLRGDPWQWTYLPRNIIYNTLRRLKN